MVTFQINIKFGYIRISSKVSKWRRPITPRLSKPAISLTPLTKWKLSPILHIHSKQTNHPKSLSIITFKTIAFRVPLLPIISLKVLRKTKNHFQVFLLSNPPVPGWMICFKPGSKISRSLMSNKAFRKLSVWTTGTRSGFLSRSTNTILLSWILVKAKNAHITSTSRNIRITTWRKAKIFGWKRLKNSKRRKAFLRT